MSDRYARVARIYESLAQLWSLGAIARVKRDAVRDIPKGSRVLIAGGGAGEDLRAVLRRTGRATVVDRSAAMLDLSATEAAGRPDVELVHRDVRALPGQWDAATMFFVLNVFEVPEARRLLAAVSARVRVGGVVCVADFDPELGVLQRIHHSIPRAAFRVLTRNANSPIHDVPALADEVGLVVQRTQAVPVIPGLPAGYRSWVLSRRWTLESRSGGKPVPTRPEFLNPDEAR